MVEVTLEHLSKHFGDVKAVDDVSLKVKDKEFLSLLGPSGCGKITTLRCISGLEMPTSGNIFIGDEVVNDLSPKDRNVAMVFQNYAIYEHMKVFDNIGFPLKLRRVSKEELRKKVMETARLLRIEELLNRKPKELSGGERQRVAIGRAIIREPRLFLMDEPLSNLDAKLRVQMRAELVKLQRELQTTLIYVTHDQLEAMAMSDTIAIMNKGKLTQMGSPTKIYDHPENDFVAGFIGSPSMNFIECSFKEEKQKIPVLDCECFSYNLTEEQEKLVKDRASGPELTLGVRPEDINVYKQRDPQTVTQAEVYVVERLGERTILDLEVENITLRASVNPKLKVKVGEKVHLAFDREKIHVFDKKTGETVI